MVVIFSDKSLTYTKQNRGPKIDPYRTSPFSGNQSDDCPLSITCRNLLLKTQLISARDSQEISTCLSL